MKKLTKEEEREVLLHRAEKVVFFASIFGRCNALVESAAYHLLETNSTPLRALRAHIRHFLLMTCWTLPAENIRFQCELAYLRHWLRMTDGQIEAHWNREFEAAKKTTADVNAQD